MKMNKYTSPLFVLLPFLTFNVIYFLNVGFITNLFLFLFITYIPGLLINRILKIEFKSIWENIIYSVGLSIGFLMFLGLFINTVLPFFKIVHPLSTNNIFLSVDISLLLLSLITIFRNPVKNISLKIEKFTFFNKVLLIFPVIFTILSITGANYLNNTGNNIFTMTMLEGIFIYILSISFIYKKIDSRVYPFAVYFLSLSLLLSLSMRSSHITGWDINGEFAVFQATQINQVWRAIPKDAYNACLSITILPTMISALTKFNDEYIFKFFYQIIFSFTPVIVFIFLKKYVSEILAFLSVFFMISQPLFINPMTGLMRQEIAILFFGLIILTLFNSFSNKIKNFLFFFFGINMVISHYSTTYISLVLLSITLILTWIAINKLILFKILRLKSYKLRHIAINAVKIPLWGLLSVIIFAILWYGVATKISGNLIQILFNTGNNIPKIVTEGPLGNEARQALGLNNVSPNDLLSNYVNTYSSHSDLTMRYSIKDYDKYPLKITSTQTVKPEIESPLNSYILDFFIIIRILIKLFLVIGLIAFLINKSIKRKFDIEYLIFTIVSAVILILIIIDPILSINYNVSRVYLQLLIFLAFITTYGGITLLKNIKFIQNYSFVYILGFIYGTLFLFYSGLIIQFAGGNPLMTLNNYGEDYDKFYEHQSEISAAIWLGENRDINSTIFSDALANLRIISTIRFNTYETLIPSVILKDSYIYADYANVKDQIVEASYNGTSFKYKFPTEFLKENKNLIYNNGGSNIYK